MGENFDPHEITSDHAYMYLRAFISLISLFTHEINSKKLLYFHGFDFLRLEGGHTGGPPLGPYMSPRPQTMLKNIFYS